MNFRFGIRPKICLMIYFATNVYCLMIYFAFNYINKLKSRTVFWSKNNRSFKNPLEENNPPYFQLKIDRFLFKNNPKSSSSRGFLNEKRSFTLSDYFCFKKLYCFIFWILKFLTFSSNSFYKLLNLKWIYNNRFYKMFEKWFLLFL